MKRSISFTVDAELHEWFDENFSIASKQAFFEQCLMYLRVLVDSGTLPVPNVYPARSAMEAARHILRVDKGSEDE